MSTRHHLVGSMRHWEAVRAFQIKFLLEYGLKPGERFLDVGCGTLRGGIPIIAYLEAGNYYGLEARAVVLDEARKELVEAGLEHKKPYLALCGPMLEDVQFPFLFDMIWCWEVFQHLADSALDPIIGVLARHLKPECGRLIADAPIGPTLRLGTWLGFPNWQRPLDVYKDIGAKHNLSFTELGVTRDFGHTVTRGRLDRIFEMRKANGDEATTKS